MKINKIENTLFQKRLVAKGSVIKNGKAERVRIFELNEKDDHDYFRKAWEDENWHDANYLGEIEAELIYDPDENEKIYSMEDRKGNVLGLSEVINHKNSLLLDYLETAPNYSINTKGRKGFKYIGETMLSFLVSLCKRDNKSLTIPDVAERSSTRDFYFKNCGLDDLGYNKAVLRKRNFDTLLEQNETHTGSAIEILV